MSLLRIFFTSALVFASAQAWPATFLELADLQLIDGTGANARHVDRLIARDGVIIAIGREGDVPEPGPGDTWTRVDVDGAWVMPGLIDTHVHVGRFPDARRRAEQILRQAVVGGVTAVLDLGGDARALADTERAMVRDEFIGPTLVHSAMVGGAEIFESGPIARMAPGRGAGKAPWNRAVDDDDDIALLIAQALGSGAGNLKLYGNLDADLASALIVEAKRQGLRTTAHATVFPARPSDLVEAGIDILSHAAYLVWEAVDEVPADYAARTQGPWEDIPADHPRLLALYRQMARRGTSLDATLFVYRAMNEFHPMVKADWAESAFRWGAEAVRHAHAAGVRVTTGTDWFEPRHDSGLPNTHAELQLLVEFAGFSPMEAIVAGTRHGAEAIALTDRGTLEIGKAADLLVLDANPLEDIAHTARLRMVFKDGRQVVVPSF